MTNYPYIRGVARVSAPAAEPLTLAEVKAWLRIEHDDEDDLLATLIAAAREQAECRTGRSLITQSWEVTYADVAPQEIPLPHGPVQSISWLKTVAASGDETDIASDAYAIAADGRQLLCEIGLAAHRILVRYVAGFGDAAEDVPADLRQAMLQHIALMYGERETVLPPVASVTTYAQYRGVRL